MMQRQGVEIGLVHNGIQEEGRRRRRRRKDVGVVMDDKMFS